METTVIPVCPKCGSEDLKLHIGYGVIDVYCINGHDFKDLRLASFAQFSGPSAPQPTCKGCEKGLHDYFEHDKCLVAIAVGMEQARWQHAIYELARKHAIAPDDIDGSGCDSGDPLDLTLAEVGQVICQLENPQDYRESGPSAPQPQPPLFAMKPLQEQVEICEQNGTKWAHFKVSEIRELLSPSSPAGSAGQEPLRISFDIGGVLSKYPEVFRPMVAALQTGGAEVYVITDMHEHEKSVRFVRENGYDIPAERILNSDYTAHGEGCKAETIKQYGISIHLDDFAGYCAHTECVSLFVWPNPSKPYYADDFKTDGTEGDFGRRKAAKI